jgi:hypothetical protein
MGRPCTVCNHQNRDEIDQLLIRGESYRAIVGKFGLAKSSLERHYKGGHIQEFMAKSHEAQDMARADALLGQLREIREKANDLLNQAEVSGDLRACGLFLKELREQTKLMAELEGRLESQPQIHLNQMNIYQSPAWSKVGEILARNLTGYPGLKSQIAKELLELAKEGHEPAIRSL